MNDQVNRSGGTHDEQPGGHDHDRAPGSPGPLGPDDLRGLLHGAVGGLAPSDGALERLRHAVPVRRARKRRAVIGAAAAVLLCGTAVPAAMHLTAAESPPGDHPAMAGHGAAAEGEPGGGSSDPHAAGGGEAPATAQPPAPGQGAGGADSTPGPAASAQAVGGAGTGPAATGAATGGGPLPPAAAGLPGCADAQLGVVASARGAEADGKVYGSFRVTNVSAAGCTVTGADTVTAAPASGAATGKTAVTVLAHTAGDPATGLPDPAVETPGLILQPAAGYEVRFAWVPDTPCTGATAEPGTKTPPAGTAQDTGARADADSGTGAQPSASPTPQGAGIAVTHTVQPGAPATRTTLPAACGGTLYRTGVIALDAAPTP
ncbi:hypothetical protein ABZY31_09095 [Streptomyces sp. NPDC006529]|uniref:hypothetical protein n=1 Tax=Streptomyces sp. NPDC006529 TaxID=3157177 RepID=UPI0033AEB58A